MRRGGAGLQRAGQRGVEGSDGDVHRGQALRGHGGDQIQVGLDGAGLGDQAKRMPRLLQHTNHRTRQPQLTLDGLVTVGRRAQRDLARHIGTAAQLGA